MPAWMILTAWLVAALVIGAALGVGGLVLFRRRANKRADSFEERDTVPLPRPEDLETIPIPNFPSNPRKALLSLNSPERPYLVSEDEDGVVTLKWNLADPKWAEAIRAGGLAPDYRVEVKLEGNSHTAHVTEHGSAAPANSPAQQFQFQFGPGGFTFTFDPDIALRDARRALRSAGWAIHD